ncbi:hypothetical protein [Botrimarina mediterranea]|nr:hypothetical protein [Botrimarina mediterranea]
MYPSATPTSMQMLVTLLDSWGVALRVVNGDLQLRDPEKRLTTADRAMVRAYAADLVRLLSDPPVDAHYQSTAARYPTECRSCGADLKGDSVAYRTDHQGELLERCVSCGETWLWGEPSPSDAQGDLVTKPRESRL